MHEAYTYNLIAVSYQKHMKYYTIHDLQSHAQYYTHVLFLTDDICNVFCSVGWTGEVLYAVLLYNFL